MSRNSDYQEIAPGVWRMKIVFANIYMVSLPNNKWVLVDAGLYGSSGRILGMARVLFGEKAPEGIILTHGHFDHVGALKGLIDVWKVPVYAHRLELPYLTGISAYPPPDPITGGGIMSYMSVLYPRRPIELGKRVLTLNQSVLSGLMPGWTFIETPGHSPGHISLFRNDDKVLLAGDAFVTTKQESLIAVISQKEVVSGPPRYFTTDWRAALKSLKTLRSLEPDIAGTGHGKPMYGNELREGIDELIRGFHEHTVPRYGRYVEYPAHADRRGMSYLPPETWRGNAFKAGLAAAAAGLTFYAFRTILRKRA